MRRALPWCISVAATTVAAVVVLRTRADGLPPAPRDNPGAATQRSSEPAPVATNSADDTAVERRAADLPRVTEPAAPPGRYEPSRAERSARTAVLSYAAELGVAAPSFEDLTANQWEAVRRLVGDARSRIQVMDFARALRVNELAVERRKLGALPRSPAAALESEALGGPAYRPLRPEYAGQLVASVYTDDDRFECRIGPGEDAELDRRTAARRTFLEALVRSAHDAVRD